MAIVTSAAPFSISSNSCTVATGFEVSTSIGTLVVSVAQGIQLHP